LRTSHIPPRSKGLEFIRVPLTTCS